MPYTTDELKHVDFYREFRDELRNSYKDEIKKFINSKFRKDGILYSFEDIVTSLGLEDSTITGENSEYSFLVKEDYSMYPAHVLLEAKNNPDITLVPEVTDHREDQYSKTEKLYPLYNNGELLDKVIDREISELVTPPATGGSLPEGIKNGDRVAVESDFEGGSLGHPLDIWFIEDDKKRKYQDKFAFFSSGFSKSTIELRSKSDIDSIVDGEDITIGWRGWPTDNGSEGIF